MASRAGFGSTGANTRPVRQGCFKVEFPACGGDDSGAFGQSLVRRWNKQAHMSSMDQKPDKASGRSTGSDALDDFTGNTAPVVHADQAKRTLFGCRQRQRGQASIIFVVSEVESIMRESPQIVLCLGALIGLRPQGLKAVLRRLVHFALKGQRLYTGLSVGRRMS